MKRKLTPIEIRAAAAQQLLDDWRGRPIDWKKRHHCVRMLTDHLRRLKHKPPLAKAGHFTSPLGARQALKRLGVASVGEILDQMGFERIPPAAALVGDIIEIPGEPPFGAFTVALGNGRVLGWHEDIQGADVLQPVQFVAAWRISPR